VALCRFKDRLNTRPHDVYLELTLYRSFHAFSLAEDCTCSVLSLGDYMSKPKRPAFEVHAEGNLKGVLKPEVCAVPLGLGDWPGRAVAGS